VIPDDVHEPDEAGLAAACNGKYACNTGPVQLFVVLFAGDHPPALPIRRRLNKPQFQMTMATICADCVMRWRNPPLLEIDARQNVARVRNILV
jgi:hypothetical protein